MGPKGGRAGHPEALVSVVLEKVVTSDSQSPRLRGSIRPSPAKQNLHPTFLISATPNPASHFTVSLPSHLTQLCAATQSTKQGYQQSLALVLFLQSPGGDRALVTVIATTGITDGVYRATTPTAAPHHLLTSTVFG